MQHVIYYTIPQRLFPSGSFAKPAGGATTGARNRGTTDMVSAAEIASPKSSSTPVPSRAETSV
ncbi:MAG: hypothetical protein P4L51_11005 [Puia sp.]|nr:hypothetical protein [Puia sp.]